MESVRKYRADNHSLDEALDLSIDDCIREHILEDFFRTRRDEVKKVTLLDFTFEQDKNTTMNKKALLNLEIIHKFVLACLERVKKRYNRSLKAIRKHMSNNFEEFFPEFIAYLLIN